MVRLTMRLPTYGRAALAVLACLLAAGCALEDGYEDPGEPGQGPGVGDPGYEDPGGEPGWSVHGTFTRAATQQQMEELQGKAAARGGDLLLMESFPVQFHARGFTAEACDAFQAEAETLEYVDDVGSCGPSQAAT